MQKNLLVPRTYNALGAALAILAGCSASAAFGNTIGVANTNDSGPGSLRSAMASAAAGDTIYFNPKAIQLPATITLTSTLFINQSLTILGPGASLLSISGGHAVGVIYIGPARVVSLSGVTIQNGNAYPGAGGGIFNDGALTLSNSILSGNNAAIGGAIYNQQNTLTLSNSTLSGNSAEYGAGIYNFGTLTVGNSTLSGNSSSYAYSEGGGIFNEGTLSISDSTLSGNSAYIGGGLLNLQGVPATLSNSTLSGNSARSYGGGIYNEGTLTLSFSTLSGNSAPYAGGIYNSSGSALLKNTMVAKSPGGNCSVAAGILTSLGHNLSDDPTCASRFNQPGDMNSTGAGLDPAGLNNNGGPTPTIALLPTSVAVDAIPVSACTDVAGHPFSTDQRGVARPQGRACDIGAFELVPAGAGLPLPLFP
ncbi:MAG TPA: choice-of-anchor Q domain-containing protein [Bryobacteraceae bacterium]|nr:choice-of-anchor Q domain-containing protein [Bryobacteraceae bacterium]